MTASTGVQSRAILSYRLPVTYVQAAIEVLRAKRTPMTTREILAEAIQRGLIIPRGKTPQASLSAALYREVHRNDTLRRLFVPGKYRARRGSVRWSLGS